MPPLEITVTNIMAKRKSNELQRERSDESSSLASSKKFKVDDNDYKKWSVSEVNDFLEENEVDSEIATAFIAEQITGDILPDITEAQLKDMDIEPLGTRLRILKLLRQLQPQAPSIPFINIHKQYQFKVFNDPIHGHIEFHPLCVKIIDTLQFQRLRSINQLGAAYYVFPGGCHHRFEHCLGVSHLAGELARALQSRQPELNITDEDILCVEIAGLCHDLGHGPFSHMFDGKFIPEARPNYKWEHEDASVQMFDYLVQDNCLEAEFEKHNLTEKDRKFICEQICGPSKNKKEGEWNYAGRTEEKAFLYEIVANKRNGIDVDKWDYFARDCYHLGINNNFDHKRFMKFARVLKVDGQMQICSRDKEVGNLYDMFNTRSTLHRRAYQHKSCNVIEHMIVEALLKADAHILTEGTDGKMRKISECIDDMVAYAKLDDTIFQRILNSRDEKLKESREILQRIQQRKLYKCVGLTKPDAQNSSSFVKSEDAKKMAQEIVSSMSEHELGSKQLDASDIIVEVITYNYGKHDKNPIDFVRFYKKTSPTVAIQVRKEDVSRMLPEMFAEQELRVYVKKTDEESVATATKCFERWCAENKCIHPKDGDTAAIELTPCKANNVQAVTYPKIEKSARGKK